MRIPRYLVDVLEARGMTRRRIGALLRAIDEQEDVIGPNEARYQLALALGSADTPFENDIYGFSSQEISNIVDFQVTIGKGVELVAYRYPHPDHPTRYELTLLDQNPPHVVMAALVGAPLSRLIDHPSAPRDAIIDQIRIDDGKMRVAIQMERGSAGSEILAPVSMLQMQLEARAIARERRREVIEAEAQRGYTLRTLGVCATVVAAALAFGVYLSMSGGNPTWALATPLVSALVCGVVTLPSARREDPYLLPRLQHARWRRLQERRDELYEGRVAK